MAATDAVGKAAVRRRPAADVVALAEDVDDAALRVQPRPAAHAPAERRAGRPARDPALLRGEEIADLSALPVGEGLALLGLRRKSLVLATHRDG